MFINNSSGLNICLKLVEDDSTNINKHKSAYIVIIIYCESFLLFPLYFAKPIEILFTCAKRIS